MSTKAPTTPILGKQEGRDFFPKKISEHEHLFPPNLALLLHRQDQRVTITDSPVRRWIIHQIGEQNYVRGDCPASREQPVHQESLYGKDKVSESRFF